MKERLRRDQASGRTPVPLPAHLTGGLTVEQLFFVAYGQTWCSKNDDAFEMEQMKGDVHSPPFARVNGPLSNNVDFHDAFQCQPGTPMNPLPPQHTQCPMW